MTASLSELATGKQPCVLLIDSGDEQFAQVRRLLESETQLTSVSDLATAESLCSSSGLAPELVFFTELWPGHLQAAAVERIRPFIPLARWWILQGSLCEGEARSGAPVAGVLRAYWHQAAPRYGSQLASARGGTIPPWALPATAGDDERLITGALQPHTQCIGLVAIVAPIRETAEALADACQLCGYTTVWLNRSAEIAERFVAVLWDTVAEHCGDAARVDELSRSAGSAPIIALLNFPRIEEVVRAHAAGVSAVVSKPFLLDELFWQLNQLPLFVGMARAGLAAG